MNATTPSKTDAQDQPFLEQARMPRPSMMGELCAFLLQNKKWWLLPIVIVLALFALLLLAGPGVAPFIYTLF